MRIKTASLAEAQSSQRKTVEYFFAQDDSKPKRFSLQALRLCENKFLSLRSVM